MPAKARAKPTDNPPPAGRVQLSADAQALFDDVAAAWDLSPPVRALLQLAAEALTKAQEAEAITAVEGMTIGDNKGAAKPHPAALLARDYRSMHATTLQRLLAHLER
jgi:hypothetical protein